MAQPVPSETSSGSNTALQDVVIAPSISAGVVERSPMARVKDINNFGADPKTASAQDALETDMRGETGADEKQQADSKREVNSILPDYFDTLVPPSSLYAFRPLQEAVGLFSGKQLEDFMSIIVSPRWHHCSFEELQMRDRHGSKRLYLPWYQPETFLTNETPKQPWLDDLNKIAQEPFGRRDSDRSSSTERHPWDNFSDQPMSGMYRVPEQSLFGSSTQPSLFSHPVVRPRSSLFDAGPGPHNSTHPGSLFRNAQTQAPGPRPQLFGFPSPSPYCTSPANTWGVNGSQHAPPLAPVQNQANNPFSSQPTTASPCRMTGSWKPISEPTQPVSQNQHVQQGMHHTQQPQAGPSSASTSHNVRQERIYALLHSTREWLDISTTLLGTSTSVAFANAQAFQAVVSGYTGLISTCGIRCANQPEGQENEAMTDQQHSTRMNTLGVNWTIDANECVNLRVIDGKGWAATVNVVTGV